MTLLSDEAERLIRDARAADAPPPERLRAIARDLLPKVAAGSAVALSAAQATALAGAAAPVATKAVLGTGSLVSSLLVGGAAGVAVVAAGALWRAPAASEIPRAHSALVSPSARPLAPAPIVPPRAQVAETATDAEHAPKAPATAVADASPSADPASTLASEVHLLNGAQYWITAGDGPRALAIIDRYLAEHPRGALREELLAARVLALCLSGDHGAARSAARAFVANSPRSPQLPRLARSCVADVEGLPAPVDSTTDSKHGSD